MLFSVFEQGTVNKTVVDQRQKKQSFEGFKKIKVEKINQVHELIKDIWPDQLKLSFRQRTVEAKQQRMLNRFKTEPIGWQACRYLITWRYSTEVLCNVLEENQEKVKKWIEDEYPPYKKGRSKKIISLCDETGMQTDHQTRRSYAAIGETTDFKKPGLRFSLNVINAISNKGNL